MKRRRTYPNVVRRWYRPIEHECLVCQRTLQQAMTLTRRTVITLEGVIKLIHAGYRCPDVHCEGHRRTYRSPAADALARPRMTYGLDSVLLVGRLRLSEHRTVDEIHREKLSRLEPLGVRIARREILYLFEKKSRGRAIDHRLGRRSRILSVADGGAYLGTTWADACPEGAADEGSSLGHQWHHL